MPTLKTASGSLRADALQERGLEEPPAFATNPQAKDRSDARLPRIDETVSVCMFALAFMNNEDAEKTRLDDVFAEHQRDGSHCSDSYVTSACAQLQLPPRACLRSACIAVRRPKRQPQVPLLVRAHQQLIRRVAALQTPHVSIGGLSCILRPSGPAKRSSFERRL